MDISIILARILGILFLVLGISLFNRKTVVVLLEEMERQKGFSWLGGLIAVVFGAVIVSLGGFWFSDWRVVISVIGWLSLLKGFFILVFPESSASFYHEFKMKCSTVGGIAVVVIGLFLCYTGFFA